MKSTNTAKNPTVYNRTNSWWKNRTKMEKEQLVLLVLISVVLLGFLVYVIVINALKPNTCKTSACVLAASQIVSHIDPTVQPCDNFFKFACGRFIKESHGDYGASSIKKQKDRVARQQAEIIKDPIHDTDSYWIKDQKQFFKACMNATAVEEESLNVLNTMLEEVHGWPVVMTFRWKEALFDWKELIYKFVRKGYYHSMMLNVWIIEDPVKNNWHIVSVKEPSVNVVKEESKYYYKQFMVDVAVRFGADRGRAEIEMQRVLVFMEQLNIVAELNRLYDNEESNTTILLENRYTVQNFSEENMELDWLDYINNVLHPVSKISNEDYVIFPTKVFVKAFFDLIEKTEKRILANYIIWTLIEESIPYLTKELKELALTYKWKTGQKEINRDRFTYCKSEIDKNFYPRPYEIQYARKYLPENEYNLVKNFFKSIKTEFIKVLQQSAWMDHVSKIRVTEKVNAVLEILGAPRDYFNDAILEQVLGNISFQEPTINRTYFEMVLHHRKLLSEAGFFRLHMSVNSTKLDEFFATPHVNAIYSPPDNVIVLPVGILQGIFYNPYRPMYLNYGSLGSIIAHELTHGFGEASSKYDKDGQEINIWTSEIAKTFQEKMNCIVEEANHFTTNTTDYLINGTQTLEENLADYTGLKVSYQAYQEWVYEHGAEPHLIGVEYTPNQLFWIAAAAHECYITHENKSDDLHAPNEFRVIAPMRNNPNFAEDFKCAEGSYMNPINKCQVF